MKTALINNLTDGRKVYASTYSIEVRFAEGYIETHEVVAYTFEDVFERVTEIYEGNENRVEKITFEVVEGR